MFVDFSKIKIFLRPGFTDMRKAANGLSIFVQEQMRLFDEAEQGSKEEIPVETVEVSPHRRRKRGRRPLPASLPRQEIVRDIPEV